jgi:hypothetical protein
LQQAPSANWSLVLNSVGAFGEVMLNPTTSTQLQDLLAAVTAGSGRQQQQRDGDGDVDMASISDLGLSWLLSQPSLAAVAAAAAAAATAGDAAHGAGVSDGSKPIPGNFTFGGAAAPAAAAASAAIGGGASIAAAATAAAAVAKAGGGLPAHTAAPNAAAAAAHAVLGTGGFGTGGDSSGAGVSSQTAVGMTSGIPALDAAKAVAAQHAALLLHSDGLLGPEQEQLLQECNKYVQQRGNNMGAQ